MKLTPKKFLLIALLVVAITVIGLNWDQIKKMLASAAGTKAAAATPGTAGQALPSPSNPVTAAPILVNRDYDKILKNGTKTPLTGEVKELQTLLNGVNAAKKLIPVQLVVDNSFGAKTEAMLYAYAGVKQITLTDAYNAYRMAVGK